MINQNFYNLTDTLRQDMSMNPSKLYDMGQRVSRLVHEKFDYRNVAKMTLGLYDKIMTSGKS